MAEISFAVRVSNSGPLTSVRRPTRAAVESEQMDFDSIFLHDHVVWSTDMRRRHISSGAQGALGDGQSADFFESHTTIGYLGDHISFKDAEIVQSHSCSRDRSYGSADAAPGRTGRVRDGWAPGWLSPAEMACDAEIVRQMAEEHDSKPDDTTVAVGSASSSNQASRTSNSSSSTRRSTNSHASYR